MEETNIRTQVFRFLFAVELDTLQRLSKLNGVQCSETTYVQQYRIVKHLKEIIIELQDQAIEPLLAVADEDNADFNAVLEILERLNLIEFSGTDGKR